METDGSASAKTASKKQQRDARRLQEYQEAKRAPQSVARWQLLAQRMLWTARKDSCNAVWTRWMRSRTPEAQLEARRKLRSLLWREWTRPQIDPPSTPTSLPGGHVLPMGLQVLGARSLRDEYVLARVRAFTNHSSIRLLRASGLRKALWAWLGFRRVIDFDRTHSVTRSPETAGLSTPGSARNRKKKARSGRG